MVLLVDRNPRSLRVLAQQFQHDCVSASTAERAASLASHYQPEGIVIDADFAAGQPDLLTALRVSAPVSALVVVAQAPTETQAATLLHMGAAAYLERRDLSLAVGLIRRIARQLRGGARLLKCS